MTLCLYECLKAVGLQHHYTRFTSMGVCHAAHLSELIMEDYAKLGIHTMEDRTQLFHLVKMVKSDLVMKSDDYADKRYSVLEGSFTYEAYEDDDDDYNNVAKHKRNAVPFVSSSCICRRLDFTCETTDPQLCGSKGNSPCRTHFHSHPPDGNSMVDFIGGISTHNSDTSLLPQGFSVHKPKPRPAIVTPKRFDNKRVEHHDRKEISRKQKQNHCKENGSNEASGHINKAKLVYESKRTAGYNYGLPNSFSPSVNKRRSGDQRISVCVRKRPLTHAESRRGETDVVTTLGGACVIVNESKEAVDRTQFTLQHKYYFDHVFGEEILNEEVYQRTVYPLVQHMLSGGKATCFAYGQTGAGKTHTMLGLSPRTPGLYALAVRDIFAHLSSTPTHSPLLVYVSFFEIYCGQLYDLLDHRKRLFSREDGQKVVHIAGLHYVRVDSVSSLLEVILQGTEERSQGMSGVNPLSSRSHALLQIELRGSNQEAAGRMWFVDLAGSERASDAKEPDKQSRMEGAEINQSLLALKECIRSLDQEQSHTPFRQSKLTQVLKDSFVGESMTCMIANISPGYLATEHTLNTLRYADRVKELRGQGGQKVQRKSKMSSSPKHNLFSINGGSVGIRGRSPPKKAKLSRQKEASGPVTPTKSLPMENAFLCSTPKNCKWGEETCTRANTGVALEHTTPVRGWLGTDDKKETRERADEKKDKGGENYKCGITENSGQPTDGQLHWRDVQGEETTQEGNLPLSSMKAGSFHRETENQQSTLSRGREEKRGLDEQHRQVEISRDAHNEVGRVNKTNLGEDKERHLRQYHQQLQRFMPPNASSSVYPHSNFKCPSFSTSLQTSRSPSLSLHSCSSLQQSYRGKIHRGQLPFPSDDNDKNDRGHCNSGGSKEWEGTDTTFGEGRAERDKMRSEKATGKAFVRKEEKRPAGIKDGERRCTLVSRTEAEHTDRMTGEIINNTEGQISYNCDSEDVDKDWLNVSGAPADVAWHSEEEGEAGSCGLVSIHSNNGSNSLFNHPTLESPQQRAPAEQPFSPACKDRNTCLTPNKSSNVSFVSKQNRCTSNSLFLPLQNTLQAMPSTIHTKDRQCLDTYDVRQPFSKAHSAKHTCTTSTPQAACKIPAGPVNKQPENSPYTQVQSHLDIKTKMSVLPQDENYADSLCIMDPLSISLLQVDQQVATASFLQGEHCNTSACLPESEIRDDNTGFVEDEELCLSVLELPKTKTQCTPHSDNVTAVNTERREEIFFTTNEHCGKDGVLDQLKTVPSQGRHTEQVNNSLQSNRPTEPNDQEQSTNNQQIKCIYHHSTLENLNHAQWCVVKAHWEKLEQMEALCHKEGLLLCQLPDIAFGEYVHKLEKIMEREAQCVHSMRAQLQPYLKPIHSNQSKIKENMFKN